MDEILKYDTIYGGEMTPSEMAEINRLNLAKKRNERLNNILGEGEEIINKRIQVMDEVFNDVKPDGKFDKLLKKIKNIF